MNKVLVAVFNNEKAAFEGLSALKDLHKDADITLYATAVLTKDAAGRLSVKQSADEGPIGFGIGMLTGSMVGLLGGPVGVAVGASLGALTGSIADLARSGIDVQFVEDVSKALGNGKAVVLAEVEESWTTPVDTRLRELGGMVFRRLRSEVVEDQLARESAAFKTELKQLGEDLAQAHAENKAEIKEQIAHVKKSVQAMQDATKARIEETKRLADAKITTLQGQIRQASERRKAKLEKRVADVKAELDVRLAKLQEAGRLTKEALVG
jgi:uncharacterized membrane protein